MSIPEPPAWEATPADVAALLRARTKDDTGRELGAWTENTRPTEAEVQTLIDFATREVVGPSGPGDACARLSRAAIAYRAACLVELSYFPEQVRSDRSPYEQLKGLLDEALQALDVCITSGATNGGQAGGEGYSYHSLPIVPATTAEGADATVWRHPEHPATWQRALVPPSDAEPALVDEPDPAGPYEGDIVIGHPPLPPGPALDPDLLDEIIE